MHSRMTRSVLIAGKTSCQRADSHSIRWTLRTLAFAGAFRPLCVSYVLPITSDDCRARPTLAFVLHRLLAAQKEVQEEIKAESKAGCK
jgi:hypothetical protein